MAKSSIHIQRAVEGSVGHNSREHFSYSVVFTDDGEVNECTHSVEDAYKIYRAELKERTQAYENRTGQKLQKSAVTQLSAIINLEKHHTLKDLESIKKHLEKTFGTKVYQMAIHRDEGKLISKIDGTELYSGKDFYLNTENKKFYFDKQFTKEIDLKDYEIVKNYHAHIEMMGLDKDGNAIRQKMNKRVLKEMQTFVAKELKMERGKENVSYSQEEMKQILAVTGNKNNYESNTLFAKRFNEVAKDLGLWKEKTKRQDTHIFKDVGSAKQEAKREVFKEVLATKDQLKEANNQLRAFMKENQAVRTDYAPLEAEKKLLEEKLKAKELTEKELLEKFQELEKSFLKEKGHLTSLIEVKDIDIIDLNNQNKSLEELKTVLTSKVTSLELKTAHSSNIAPSDVLTEFKKIQKEEIKEKIVKVSVLKSEKIQVLENPESFIKKAWNLISSKYNQLLEEVKALKSENKAMKIELAQLKDNAQTIVPKQQKESSDIFEKIQSEAKRNHEATFLIDKEKETQTTVKIRRDR